MNRRELMRAGVKLGVASSVAAAALPTAGCATLWDLVNRLVKAPTIDVRKMDITGMSLASVSMRFHTLITNPNPFGLRLEGLDYLVKVAGGELAKGRAPRGITVKPRSRVTNELDLEFDLGKTASAILELITKRSASYELQAVAKLLSRDGGLNVPFSHAGVLPLPTLPKVNIRSFAPTSLSSAGVGFAITTEIKNENDFEIPVDGLNLDLKLDGRRVLANRAVDGLRVAPGKTGRLPFEFRVRLDDLGMSLAEVASGRRVQWELATQLKSGRLVAPFSHEGSIRLAS